MHADDIVESIYLLCKKIFLHNDQGGAQNV